VFYSDDVLKSNELEPCKANIKPSKNKKQTNTTMESKTDASDDYDTYYLDKPTIYLDTIKTSDTSNGTTPATLH
jgi:hypothetical protein